MTATTPTPQTVREFCDDMATDDVLTQQLRKENADLRAKLAAAVRVIATAYPTTADEMNAVIRQISEITHVPAERVTVWSGYDDDECGFPLFTTKQAAQSFAEWQFRKDHGTAFGTDAYDLDHVSFVERKAYTDAHNGRAGLFDLTTDNGSTGYVVCEYTVHATADAAIREDEAKGADQ